MSSVLDQDDPKCRAAGLAISFVRPGNASLSAFVAMEVSTAEHDREPQEVSIARSTMRWCDVFAPPLRSPRALRFIGEGGDLRWKRRVRRAATIRPTNCYCRMLRTADGITPSQRITASRAARVAAAEKGTGTAEEAGASGSADRMYMATMTRR